MGDTVCLSTSPAPCKFLGPTSVGDCHFAGAKYWSSIRQRGDGSREEVSSSSGMAAMDSRVLPSGLGGSNLTHVAKSWALSSSSSRRRRRRSTVQNWVSHGYSTRVKCEGLMRGLPKVLRFIGVECPLSDGLRRRESGGFGLSRCRQWRVRATDSADGAEQDPLGEEGYWDGAEGKQQLDDIEDMLELIAEAENLRKTDSAEGAQGELTSEEIQKRRAEKLREELARRAKQQADQRKQAEIMFGLGQRAYGSGVYDKSVAFLEGALSNVPGSSNIGGEIQIWLAMAYDAHNRHGDCIALYKRLEASHPNKQIRRQAADLRYILEAPKLKISKDEMVSIPIIERDYDRDSKSWSQRVRDRRRKPISKSKSKDYLEDWLVWDPPRWERNPYFWVAFTVWLTLVGVSLMFQD